MVLFCTLYCTQYRYADAWPAPIRGVHSRSFWPNTALLLFGRLLQLIVQGLRVHVKHLAAWARCCRCWIFMYGSRFVCFPMSLGPHYAFGDVSLLQQRKSESARVQQWASFCYKIPNALCDLYFRCFLRFLLSVNMAVKSEHSYFGF